MTTTTYSLTEVAAMVLPPEWKQPELWLMRRLRRGDVTGYKVGRVWRMRQSDVDALIDRHANRSASPKVVELPQGTEPVSVLDGLSARARARLAS